MHDLRSRLAPGKLVTLVGPGGVGKTRLAIEIGVTVAPEWTEGVWLVELHDLGEGSLVTSAIVSAVGAPTGGHIDGRDALIEHPRTKNAFLILDNCEHVAADCAAVVQAVLVACPWIGVLATSREPLGVPGELRSRIDPLDVSGADASTSPPAVEPFIQRARRLDPTSWSTRRQPGPSPQSARGSTACRSPSSSRLPGSPCRPRPRSSTGCRTFRVCVR